MPLLPYPENGTRRKEAEEREKATRAAHPDWPQEVVRAVALRRPLVGMDREQALAAIGGRPHKITKNVAPDGARLETWFTVWAYRSPRLQFENGILKNIEIHGARPPAPPSPPGASPQ